MEVEYQVILRVRHQQYPYQQAELVLFISRALYRRVRAKRLFYTCGSHEMPYAKATRILRTWYNTDCRG